MRVETQKFIIIDDLDMSKANATKTFVLVVILAGAVYFALRQHQPAPLAIGERATDFSVPAVPSGSLDLKNYRGQIVVLNFWATWCPPCVEETPSLEQFAEKMRDHGVVVLGVSVDEDEKALQNFVRENGISFPIGRDPNRAISNGYGTFQYPETYIMDRHGVLAEKVIGFTDWNDTRIQNFVLDLAGAAKP
jgi:peroxiredoxin